MVPEVGGSIPLAHPMDSDASSRSCADPLIYAEVSIRFDRIEELQDALPEEDFLRLPLPWEAAFLAGKCFVWYRRRMGARTSPLPDFCGYADRRRKKAKSGFASVTIPGHRRGEGEDRWIS